MTTQHQRPRGAICHPRLFLCLLLSAFVGQSALAQLPLPSGRPIDPAAKRRAQIRKAQKYFDDGQKLLNKRKIIRAKSKFKAAIEIAGLEGPGQAAFAALRGIHEEGMRELIRAKGMYDEKKFVESLALSKRIKSVYANLFGGLKIPQTFPNIARLATRLIRAIDKNPAAQIEIQEHEATKRLKRITRLEERVKKDPIKYYELYKAYRTIAKRYPDCPTGRDCAEQAIKLRSHKKKWKIIKRERRRRDIASALSSISTLEAGGLIDKAEKELAALMKKYPGKTRKQLEAMASK